MRIHLLLGTALLLASCAKGGESPEQQTGPNPHLPAIQQYLMPPMHVAGVAPWSGAVPSVASGLRIAAFADGFKNVRSVYVLPNGDVLAVEPKGPTEPVSRPKDIVVNFIQGFGHSKTAGGNRTSRPTTSTASGC